MLASRYTFVDCSKVRFSLFWRASRAFVFASAPLNHRCVRGPRLSMRLYPPVTCVGEVSDRGSAPLTYLPIVASVSHGRWVRSRLARPGGWRDAAHRPFADCIGRAIRSAIRIAQRSALSGLSVILVGQRTLGGMAHVRAALILRVSHFRSRDGSVRVVHAYSLLPPSRGPRWAGPHPGQPPPW